MFIYLVIRILFFYLLFSNSVRYIRVGASVFWLWQMRFIYTILVEYIIYSLRIFTNIDSDPKSS